MNARGRMIGAHLLKVLIHFLNRIDGESQERREAHVILRTPLTGGSANIAVLANTRKPRQSIGMAPRLLWRCATPNDTLAKPNWRSGSTMCFATVTMQSLRSSWCSRSVAPRHARLLPMSAGGDGRSAQTVIPDLHVMATSTHRNFSEQLEVLTRVGAKGRPSCREMSTATRW
jgi:hypothetical protein